MDGAAIAAVLGALGGIIIGVGQIIKALRQYPSARKTDGMGILDGAEKLMRMYQETLERSQSDMDALRAMVDAMRAKMEEDEARIEALEDRLGEVNRKLNYYRQGVGVLIAQLRRLGHTPEWEPKD